MLGWKPGSVGTAEELCSREGLHDFLFPQQQQQQQEERRDAAETMAQQQQEDVQTMEQELDADETMAKQKKKQAEDVQTMAQELDVEMMARQKKKQAAGAAFADLPQELQDRILAYVPIGSLCYSLVLVCRAWRYLLSNPSFHILRRQPPPVETWILLNHLSKEHNSHCMAWDFRANVSFTLHRDYPSVICFPYASAHGLVCSTITPSKGKGFCFAVTNPVTTSRALVPETQFLKCGSHDIRVEMVVDPSSGAFELIVFDHPKFGVGEFPPVELFDSRTGLWQTRPCSTKPRPPGRETEFGYGSFIHRHRNRAWVAYDHGDKTWVELNLPSLTSIWERREEFVFLYKEHVTLIAACCAPLAPLGFEVWQLQQQQWVLKSHILLTPELDRKMLYLGYACHAAGDVVSILWPPVVLDLAQNSYHIYCPSRGMDLVGGMVLQPSSLEPFSVLGSADRGPCF